MRDLAPVIASVLIGMGRLPCGPVAAHSYTLQLWPHATADEVERGYEIALECWEDDYLFVAA